MKTVRLALLLTAMSATLPCVQADPADAAGCKDSPLVSRFPGSKIGLCVDKPDEERDFYTGQDKPVSKPEGHYLKLYYICPAGTTKAQLVRNMHTALQSAGYTFDDETRDGDITAHQGNTWIEEEVAGDGYNQYIVVQAPQLQLIVAHAPPPDSGTAAGAHPDATPRQPDAKGCKDSPLVSRFPGAFIGLCVDKPDETHEFAQGPGKAPLKLEGEFHKTYYDCPRNVSGAQLMRNLHTALQLAGYTLDDDSRDGVFTSHLGNTWIQEELGGDGYTQYILVKTQLTQDVVANAAALSSGINATGHMVVNGILFDFNKADIKPESAPALQEVAKLLQQDNALDLYVVGHTDNVGTLAANLELSRQRAASVVKALTTQYGIAAARLAPFGDGPYAPRTTNDTEDGRTLNRRVEVVKQ
jgi:outer membrane protein OmpA-like peptidoglycan-associated protein